MASAALIPVDVYLSHTWHPGCDYIDGELQERSWGESRHGFLRGMIGAPGTPIRVVLAEVFAELDDMQTQA